MVLGKRDRLEVVDVTQAFKVAERRATLLGTDWDKPPSSTPLAVPTRFKPAAKKSAQRRPKKTTRKKRSVGAGRRKPSGRGKG
jgi:hypothetical protein